MELTSGALKGLNLNLRDKNTPKHLFLVNLKKNFFFKFFFYLQLKFLYPKYLSKIYTIDRFDRKVITKYINVL